MKIPRFLLVPVLSLAAATVAHAHAFLDYAVPAVGSTVAPPGRVTLWMTRNLDPASLVKVFDAHLVEVDKKDVVVTGMTMVVSLPKLSAGTYLVRWKATARDQHQTSGSFSFTVR